MTIAPYNWFILIWLQNLVFQTAHTTVSFHKQLMILLIWQQDEHYERCVTYNKCTLGFLVLYNENCKTICKLLLGNSVAFRKGIAWKTLSSTCNANLYCWNCEINLQKRFFWKTIITWACNWKSPKIGKFWKNGREKWH